MLCNSRYVIIKPRLAMLFRLYVTHRPVTSDSQVVPLHTNMVYNTPARRQSYPIYLLCMIQINFNGMCQKCLIGNFLCVDACGNNYPAPMWFKTFADVVLLFKFRQVFIYNQIHAIRDMISLLCLIYIRFVIVAGRPESVGYRCNNFGRPACIRITL